MGASNKTKILLVEDDFILYQELCEFFEEKGYEVIGEQDDKAVDNYDDAVKLLKLHQPNIAVLDIKLKGDKDGIDLGVYIKEHHAIPIIYLSAYNNPGNLERIRKTGNERFVLKATKPLDKEQLWTMFYLALPKKTGPDEAIGNFFSVKEMIITEESNRQKILPKDPDDFLEIQTLLRWDDIMFIESYNSKVAGSGNNNLLIHSTTPGKGYVLRSTLSEIENQLPVFFARFDQSTIVNLKKVTGRVKNSARYLIGNLVFKISDNYKEKTNDKINRLLSQDDLGYFPKT